MSYRVAIPLYENRVSPRFDRADHFALFDCEEGRCTPAARLDLTARDSLRKAKTLASLHVDYLLSGGITAFDERFLSWCGITVIPNCEGDALEVLERFVRIHGQSLASRPPSGGALGLDEANGAEQGREVVGLTIVRAAALLAATGALASRALMAAQRRYRAGLKTAALFAFCVLLQLGLSAVCPARPIHHCFMCGRDSDRSRTGFVMDFEDGSRKYACCLRCVLLLQERMEGRTVTGLRTRDFAEGSLVEAGRACYLEGCSTLPEGSMAPFLLAFPGRESAEAYRSHHGGEIVGFERAREITARFIDEGAPHTMKGR